MRKIVWSGLADSHYWEYIARYCVPSWKGLPGQKYLITDDSTIQIDGVACLDYKDVENKESQFLKKHCKGKKPYNFWRKMQSQIYALKNFDAEYVVLLDTDIEVIEFDNNKFDSYIKKIEQENLIWAVGESTDLVIGTGVDAGLLIVKMNHPSLNEFLLEYEDFWESGKILKLPHCYDGDVVTEIIKKFRCLNIRNKNLKDGKHYYDFGLFHWGSRASKPIRRELVDVKGYIKSIL